VRIGFAILSHNEPERLLRLVKTLTAMFDAPPIVCHHDFGQSSLCEANFPKNVRFVRPYLSTQWGSITLPLAALRAFRLLRECDKPDWFFLLSSSDYPVKRGEEITAELSRTTYDAYLDFREILYRTLPPGQTAEYGFGRPSWVPLAYERYCTFGFWCPRFSNTLLLSGSFPFRIQFVQIRNSRFGHLARWLQFNRPSRIYAGDFWFHANREAINVLLDDPGMKKLVRYYRGRWISDESLFHTALCNQKDLRICNNNMRYEDWTSGAPKWLDISDMSKILASDAFFARKFRDENVLAFLETSVVRVKTSPAPDDQQILDIGQRGRRSTPARASSS
jgi:hypothetical protein